MDTKTLLEIILAMKADVIRLSELLSDSEYVKFYFDGRLTSLDSVINVLKPFAE